MAYATVADVAAYLGRSLTLDQQTQAGVYLDAASAWIDEETGRTWGPTSPITEKHSIIAPFIYLNRKPITGITSVVVRNVDPGSDDITLEDGVGYELLDASRGLISLGVGLSVGQYSSPDYVWQSPYWGYIASITYTHAITVPANIRMAAILLAASKMTLSLNPMSQRIKTFSDNRAVSVTFRDDEIPDQVRFWLPKKQVFIV